MLTREEAKSKLKKYWQNEKLEFIAEFKAVKPLKPGVTPHGYFHLKSNDRPLSFPALEGYGFKRKVTIYSIQSEELLNGEVYLVEVDLADDQRREKEQNPFSLKVIDINKIEQSFDVIPPKDFIRSWFGRKGENPGDAASIAAQLRLNQLELYTQTKRFIFELIQNADDMPMNGREVGIDIRLLNNFFLFSHNGQHFSRGDVMAICDAAKSTKRADETKTGYKGIGFKSVFSDSEKVFILSQDYSFKFDKLAEIYSEFKELYRPYWSRFSQDEQIKFFNEHKGRERELSHIDNIPWQIKPIWVEPFELPKEIKPYFSKRNNVNIALEVGAAKIQEKHYHEMIQSLVDDPRFLLFLRNARKINYYAPNGTVREIEVIKTNDHTEVRAAGVLQSVYKTFDAEISINNEAFSKAGFNFEHIQLEEGKYAFKDGKGNILNNIPEKLGRLKNTMLSFAVKNIEGKIEKISPSESILYNYLPTSDQRYSFPFIINADFISKTDREGILSENIWNHYLFFNIGYALTKWLTMLSRDKAIYSSYLNVLPSALLDETHEDLSSINSAFNKGLLLGIKEKRFIPNTSSRNDLAESLIIEDTGLSKILGPENFLAFVGSEKRLVNPDLDIKKLKTEYLGLSIYGYNELKKSLKDPIQMQRLNDSIAQLSQEKRKDFLGWLDKACENKLVFSDIAQINFLGVSEANEFVSITDLNIKVDYFLNEGLTSKIKFQLLKIGARICGQLLSELPNIEALFRKDGNTYLSNAKVYFNKLSSLFSAKLLLLEVAERIQILDAFRSLAGIDIGTINKLPWFRNSLGEYVFIGELVNNEDFVFPSSYNAYFIHQEDKAFLSAEYLNLLRPFEALLKIDSFSINMSGSKEAYLQDNALLVLLSKLIKKGAVDANIYSQLSKKILLDNQAIDGDLYHDEVTIFITNAQQLTSAVGFALHELLPNMSTGNKYVSRLLELLINLSEEERVILKNKVFVLKQIDHARIETGIMAQETPLSYQQFLYLGISAWFSTTYVAKRLMLKMDSLLTQVYRGESDTDIHRFLDFMFAKQVVNKNFVVEYQGKSYYLIPPGRICCGDNELLFDNEIVPGYLSNWIGGDENKRKFITLKGAFDQNYSHVVFRKALWEKDEKKIEESVKLLDVEPDHFSNTARFIEKMHDNNHDLGCAAQSLVTFYSKFSSLVNIDFSQFGFPVFTNVDQRIFTLKKLEATKKYYVLNTDWGLYNREVANHIFSKGNFIVPEGLMMPAVFKVSSLELQEEVDQEKLIVKSKRYEAEYYIGWSKYNEHVVNIYDGHFIPFRILFEGEVIAESINKQEGVWSRGNVYYVCESLSNEIPFCLKSMSPVDGMSLARAKFSPTPRHQPQNPRKDDLSEAEIQELERLFNRVLSATELSDYWVIACFKAMKYYESLGYDINYAAENFQLCIKKRMLEKVSSNGRELTVLPRSAKKNLLRISLQAWNSIEMDNTELFILTSDGHQIFTDHKDLMGNSDNLLFTIETEDKDEKARIVSNLFSQESISDAQYDPAMRVTLLIQLASGSSYASLFTNFNSVSVISDF